MDVVLFLRETLLFSKKLGPPSSFVSKFCVLRDLEGTLAIFEVENNKPARFYANIQLFGCKVTEINDESSPNFYLYSLEWPDGRKLFLANTTQQEREKWVFALKEVISTAPEVSEIDKNKEIDRSISQEKRSKSRHPETVLLLLGPGESGKSTVVKQIKILTCNGFTKAEKDFYKFVCVKNIVDNMRALLDLNKLVSVGLSPDAETAAGHFLEWFKSPANSLNDNNISNASSGLSTLVVPPEITKSLVTLWKDPLVSGVTMSHADESQLGVSAEYFFHGIERVTNSNFVPTEEDILRCRYKTTSVHETQFNVKENSFRIIDVGGQRGERKKWVNLFSDVTAIIFVAAISEYDQKLMEDGTTNRFDETLDVFKSVCALKAIRKTPVILMLNKDDLFREKIKKVPLSACFPEYKGDNSYTDASNYIVDKFHKLKKTSRTLYPHFTCATDTESFKIVLLAVTDIIISSMLKEQF